MAGEKIMRHLTKTNSSNLNIGRQIFDALELRPTRFEVTDRIDILERLGMETRLKENRFVDLRPDKVSDAAPETVEAKESES